MLPSGLWSTGFQLPVRAGSTSELLGVFSKQSMTKKGDFLGIASVSFSRRTLLLLGHHFTATDGTSITENHTTWVDAGKSVVTVIGAWLISTSQQRKWQPHILHRNHKQSVSDDIPVAHKAVFFFRNLEKELVIMLSLTVICQGKLDLLRQFNNLLKNSVANRNAVVSSSTVNAYRSVYPPSLTSFFVSSCFVFCLSHLWLLSRDRSESQSRQRLLFCSSCFV